MLFRSDRKSTRLNSSHTIISYAVFCLKKKKNTTVSAPNGTTPTPAAWHCGGGRAPDAWFGQGVRARKLRDATVPAAHCLFFFKVSGHPKDINPSPTRVSTD